MENRVIEEPVSCPFCAESISILVDLSAGAQTYIEDCQVCCQPMQIIIAIDDWQNIDVQVACAQ